MAIPPSFLVSMRDGEGRLLLESNYYPHNSVSIGRLVSSSGIQRKGYTSEQALKSFVHSRLGKYPCLDLSKRNQLKI
jgi:hypothetical protein